VATAARGADGTCTTCAWIRLMPEYSPLFSCFYSGRTPRASDEDDVVRQVTAVDQRGAVVGLFTG
jgi:hypothetical protein